MKVKSLIIGTLIVIIGCHLVCAQNNYISEFEIQEKIHEFANCYKEQSIQELKLQELKSKVETDSSQLSLVEKQLSLFEDSVDLKKKLNELKKTIAQDRKSYDAQKNVVKDLEKQCYKAKQFVLDALENKTIRVEKESQFNYKYQSDSLYATLKILENELDDLRTRRDSLVSALEDAKVKNMKLSDKVANLSETHKYILNYGNSLLFRKYNARIDDIVRWLDSVPKEAKQKDMQEMLDEIKTMIMKSTVPDQDLRYLVWDEIKPLLENNDLLLNNLRKVIAGVPENADCLNFSLVKHAESFIDNVSEEIKDSDNRYDIIKKLLSTYKESNQEIYDVLVSINEDPYNNNSRMSPAVRDGYISRIKNTSYYKIYYSAEYNIPFLNDIIDEAIDLMKKTNGQTKIDLSMVLNKMK